jgi:hypothetical protein
LKRERNAFLDSTCKLIDGRLNGFLFFHLDLTKAEAFTSIDAVLGNDDLVTEILLRVPAKAVLRFELVSKK